MIVVVGLSHRTAPVEVRERLAAGADTIAGNASSPDPSGRDRNVTVLARLAARSELAEVMFVSTCNRVEVVARCDDDGVDAAFRAIREELARHGGLAHDAELAPYLYDSRGDEAVRHIFRVAASLDSMVLGEPQILGQVKDAYDAALAAGALKGKLARCVSRAFAVAKRVRSETAIGTGAVSISSIAVDLARRVFGDLSDHVVLLLGAGEMAEAAARSLGRGARALRICNRNFDRAAALARDMHASAVPWEGLEAELVQADVVVASTASSTAIVTRDMVKRAMKARRGRTLLFADIAVPRNVDPSVHAIDNVYVYNIDDLEQEVARGFEARRGVVEAAEKIVTDEVAQFVAWSRGLEVQPTVVAMRAKVRAMIFAELDRMLAGKLKHLASDRAALTLMADSIVNKLLHAPTTKLRSRAASGDDAGDLAAAVRFLFDLQDVASQRDTEPGGGEDRARAVADDDERLAH
ncbi:MAG: glutamyl-tRNA reductase [Myxococcota bacterium]|nr:glutamyl-tRNA reductase [Myxococcota bacterium]